MFDSSRDSLRCVAGCLLIVCVLNAASANAQGDDIAAAYRHAERFLSWNQDRYVRNADIRTHWIGREDRFWYARRDAAGETTYVIVDAATGARRTAADRKAVAPEDAKDRNAAVDEAVSPDGRWAAYVKDYNIWVRPRGGGSAFSLTSDGIEHDAYGGTAGYSTHAVTDLRHPRPVAPLVQWSPDSRFLLTQRIDEREVEDLTLVQAVPEDGSIRPKLYRYRYALPGDAHLPMLSFVVLDVQARRQIPLHLAPSICLPQTPIEKRTVWWSEDGTAIFLVTRDRFARSIALQRSDSGTGATRTVLTEAGDPPMLTNSNNIFDFPLVRTLRNADVIWYSTRDGWGHLYYYSRNGSLRNRITQGPWAVRGIVRIDEVSRTIYFTASGREPGDPYEQHLYSVRFDGSALRLLTPERADHKWPNPFSDPELGPFSPSGRFFLDTYSRPDMPPKTVLRGVDGRLIREVESADISPLRKDGFEPIEPFEAIAADGHTKIYGSLFRPSTFDPHRSYPIVDSVYPGPQTIRVAKGFMAATFDGYQAQSLAELGFIVVTVDGRGTPNRSRAFLQHAIGHLEKASDLEDHIAAIRQLARRYSYMDLNRVGIDGVSSGGFEAALGILRYPDFYKVAVAAEGAHDQRGYLAPWGESYNGPLDRGDYDGSSTPRLAEGLRGKLLLVHGELDDNVPPALTMRLVDALIKANKDFDLLILPNANHLVALQSPYFTRRRWDYFVRNLLGVDPPSGYSISPAQ